MTKRDTSGLWMIQRPGSKEYWNYGNVWLPFRAELLDHQSAQVIVNGLPFTVNLIHVPGT
ncbi:hypothetical protein [Burkholderia phage vB_BpP_HN03]